MWCIEPASGEPCKESSGSMWGWKGKRSQIPSAHVGKAWDQCQFVIWLYPEVVPSWKRISMFRETLLPFKHVFPTVSTAHI